MTTVEAPARSGSPDVRGSSDSGSYREFRRDC